ncbi:Tm-1-like ATP-binding domain-containing protein [Bombilactobacillus folatiphilus]|uniref:Tm-1-like ATP-binding domain-containing protein n=1 Tax=Bombilactobacillus folatiphilus TaxID=2923362 RepID=A0ABY4PB83_9LACO|nr:Tm-1-like ATP-binding domain-containing protein [Bombilactobacillus folatiphilus]UQS82937.1 Tm-1-like ATP-binding domain-containing protein [Bombilactobacillus folatiphilus]
MQTIALVGTLDTKGTEFNYVKQVLERLGNRVLLINAGVFSPTVEVDIDANELAAVEELTIDQVRTDYTRGEANAILAHGLRILLPRLYQAGKFQGILSLGGSGGTSLVTPAMQQLPLGVPKVMVSTVAAGNTREYVGTSDIVMIPSIVDVSGLNKISRVIFDNAAAAISGMFNHSMTTLVDTKPLIGATMFGVTTKAVDHARSLLDQAGLETLVFHATGTGGQTMESLIAQGYFAGVLDLTTTEIADELCGGVMAAGQTRLDSAIQAHLPEVLAPGALDMVNFGPYETVPAKYRQRNLVKHNPTVTLMRTTIAENQQFGQFMAQKLNQAQRPIAVMIPTKGFSELDAVGQPFYGPEEDAAFTDSLTKALTNNAVTVTKLPYHMNDPRFTQACVEQLKILMKG